MKSFATTTVQVYVYEFGVAGLGNSVGMLPAALSQFGASGSVTVMFASGTSPVFVTTIVNVAGRPSTTCGRSAVFSIRIDALAYPKSASL